MNNLIAYMPVINRQYLGWLEKHKPFHLYLITQDVAEALNPKLGRNIVSLPANIVSVFLNNVQNEFSWESLVEVFSLTNLDLSKQKDQNWIMPDEDISHLVAGKYLTPSGCQVYFEPIWARWDMTAVKRQEPIMPDLETSSDIVDGLRMSVAEKFGQKTPDWWRQIGALAFKDQKMIAFSYCKHLPTEYETVIFGDPRINFDAGDSAGAEVYLSLHAEKGIVATCAREGISLKGASVYCTTFPCGDCARMLAECQIKELFFTEGYSVLKGFETLKAAGIRIVKVNK